MKTAGFRLPGPGTPLRVGCSRHSCRPACTHAPLGSGRSSLVFQLVGVASLASGLPLGFNISGPFRHLPSRVLETSKTRSASRLSGRPLQITMEGIEFDTASAAGLRPTQSMRAYPAAWSPAASRAFVLLPDVDNLPLPVSSKAEKKKQTLRAAREESHPASRSPVFPRVPESTR